MSGVGGTRTEITGDAVIDGPYRYRLSRQWGTGPRALWIMLNPSTADAVADDPTIRRVIGFTRAAGCDAADVVNLFALRATDPAELKRHPDPVGPDNDRTIALEATTASLVICAWGDHGTQHNRSLVVRDHLVAAGVELRVLGLTKKRQPKHPLYVPAETPLVTWRAA